MTQRQLADKSGLNNVTVCDLECGRHLPRFDTLEMVLEALGLKMEIVEVEKDDRYRT
jgi:transcriptional regulator with XRE-family HTH domain